MHRRLYTIVIVALIVGLSASLYGQAAPETKPLSFEVATIKLANPNANGGGIRPLPGGQTYVATGVPLKLIMKLMYRITDDQIVGGPDWINNERYDITAKAEKPSTVDELHVMFQNLLGERFGLKFHKETRTLPAYLLTVEKSGSKMTANPGAETFDIPIKLTGNVAPPTPPKFTAMHASMDYLCWFLSQGGARFGLVDRPVVDQTGLKGFYDFTLEFAPDLSNRRGPNGETPPTFDGPNIYEALKQQLGLKLESSKGPVEVFVIDSVHKPTED